MSEHDEQTPLEEAVEQAIDVFVYAPIGLLFEGASLLPQLVDKGKSQVSMARVLGKFAVEQGLTEAGKAAGRLGDQAAGLIDQLTDTLSPPPAAGPTANGASARPATPAARKPARKRPASGPGRAAAGASLAIPDYDGLSASQVVNRLAGLGPEELEAVRSYEAANRGRKTILSKVAQLQAR